MATTTSRPNLSATMPDVSTSGIKLLNAITAAKIWNETSLQYFLGNQNSLSLDSEFGRMFHTYFSGLPDATFAFQSLTVRAFTVIDAVSKLDFSRTMNTAEADHVLVSVDNNPLSRIEGFFQFPGTAFHDGSGGKDAWSFGALNSALSSMKATPELGGGEYANWTVIHEIGHSIGLKHTHDEVQGLPLPTVGKFMDNEKYSVMSYNAAHVGAVNFGHAVSLMALDVAAVQSLYGKEAYATGNSTYTLMNAKAGPLDLTEGDVQIGRAYYCIWDSLGVDEINYSDAGKSVLINLNDATLNTGGVDNMLKALFGQLQAVDIYTELSASVRNAILDPWWHAGGFFSQVLESKPSGLTGIAGGYTIAHGAIVENAVGGSGGDFLLGNEQANRLTGNGGADTLLGSAGRDNLLGGGGSDWLDGGSGNDMLTGSAGSDWFIFGRNTGTDRIVDFDSLDVIDLSRHTAILNFNDLKLNYMADGAEGAVITVGNDVLIVKGHFESGFVAADFQF